jgi:hypothetical protein
MKHFGSATCQHEPIRFSSAHKRIISSKAAACLPAGRDGSGSPERSEDYKRTAGPAAHSCSTADSPKLIVLNKKAALHYTGLLSHRGFHVKIFLLAVSAVKTPMRRDVPPVIKTT